MSEAGCAATQLWAAACGPGGAARSMPSLLKTDPRTRKSSSKCKILDVFWLAVGTVTFWLFIVFNDIGVKSLTLVRNSEVSPEMIDSLSKTLQVASDPQTQADLPAEFLCKEVWREAAMAIQNQGGEGWFLAVCLLYSTTVLG